jgi:hypothetical protein
MKVYKRTSEGQWAAFDEQSPLPRKLKILLKAVNGKAPEDVYIKSLGAFGDVRALLQSLEQAGLIADRGSSSSSSNKKRSAALATPSAPVTAAARPDVMPVMPVTSATPGRAGAAAPAPPIQPPALSEPVPASFERTEVIGHDAGARAHRPVEWQVLPVLTEGAAGAHSAAQDAVAEDALPIIGARPRPPVAAPSQPVAAPAPAWSAQSPAALDPRAAAALADLQALSAADAKADLQALSAADALADLQALADLATQAEVAALQRYSPELPDVSPLASISPGNMQAHNALMAAANDEPVSDAAATRATVRHAVELMSNFVLDHMARTASQVLPEIESIHSLDQWAELMDGYAMFISPTGELGRVHVAQMRRMLNEALGAADVGSKGWYA